MAFDQTTRNRLQKFVLEARNLLRKELTRQMQHDFGMDPETGKISEIDKLTHLDDARQETARMLRDTFDHYMSAQPFGGEKGALDRIAREQAFTVLNRLCALRMAEARGFLIESVANGYQSKGFQLYARLAGHSLGELGEAYQCYLFSLFDEFAVDLPVLFDRYSAMGRLFPKDTALRELLDLINAPDIAHLWAEDETIGWIYQYFNSKEERRQMRDASQAPRNSRELAVRNQFFTPRYVVEFLTDNTLGRIWYEMTQGNTALTEDCQYLVRRPDEVFLSVEQGPVLDWFQGNTQEAEPRVLNIAHSVNGYLRAGGLHEGAQEWLEQKLEAIQNNQAEFFSTQTILDVLFVLHRVNRFCEGTLEKYQHEIDTLTAILRQRVEESQREDLSQQDLLNQPVFIPLRPMKDPRDIKILDPACGSGHFLLYAFDLLETIYSEYWDFEDQAEYTLEDPSKGLSLLKELYETKDALMADLPRLVIEYNLHGIDIDPRAVQIAGLSLWLRAQRGWEEQNIKPNDRPAIQKSNTVCAEPMPGETDMLREFADSLKPRVLGQLVEIIFEKMELAGEAGPLLKIEEEIAEAVDNAREEFNKELLRRKEESGYLPGMAPKDRERSLFDFSDLPDKTRFWEMAEDKILGALKDYAEQLENGDNSRRRLFANDAAKGFAFIDLCRKRYDVVLMNPPFGNSSEHTITKIRNEYPFTYSNLGMTFIERALGILHNYGLLGNIIDKATSIRSSYADYRKKILYNNCQLNGYIDLGWEVLDANVEACCFCVYKITQKQNIPIFCIDTSSETRKGFFIKENINKSANDHNAKSSQWLRQIEFEKFPNGVPNFTIPPSLRKLFITNFSLGDKFANVKTGLSSGDNSRFYKLIWECPNQNFGPNNRWIFLSNGGEFSPYYRICEEVIDWKEHGEIIKSNKGAYIRNEKFYYRSGLAYGKRGNFFSVQVHPQDRIITNEGQGIFPLKKDNLYSLLGILNTKIVRTVINEYCGQHKENGYVSLIPIFNLQNSLELSQNVEKLVKLIRKFRSYDLEHIEFKTLIGSPIVNDLKPNGKIIEELKTKIKTIENHINKLSSEFYNLSATATSYIETKTNKCPSTFNAHFKKYYENDFILRSIIDQLVGIIFGRWDIMHALVQENTPLKTEDPLQPLPKCPPGMLQNSEGLPAESKDVPADYPIRITWNGILVDDEGHPEDIIVRVREAIQGIWKDKAEDIEQEAIEILGVSSLREYFTKPGKFFADHLKRYSKSRRQAPIYWPLSTASGSYTLWLYYHRLTDQTLYTCVNDYVEPKIKEITNSVNTLQAKSKRNRQEEKQLEDLSDFKQELVDFRDELLRVAKFWKPNLNDGVQITAAPLWQLFRHRPWQNKLKDTWQKLEKGDYDWAHMAFSIWPKRVVKTAHKDRSIAIAHDLEEALWEEVEVGRDRQGNPKYQWQPRDLSQKEMDSLIKSTRSGN